MNALPQDVFFCSGARNHRLLAHLSKKALHFEVDERIASFKALGLCKGAQRPVIVCTTSGTAVAECLPAMVEAYYSEAPLILISADRPKELQGTGAPQTIEHESITRNYRRSYCELSLEEFDAFDLSCGPFPLHLNVLIRTQDEAVRLKTPPDYPDFSQFLKHASSPLFLFSHGPLHLRELVERFSSLNIPFYAEVLSGARELSTVKTEKSLLRLVRSGQINGVVRIGHTPLSKAWRILESLDLPVYHFDPRGLRALSRGSLESLSPLQLLSSVSWWEELQNLSPAPEMKDDSATLLFELITRFPRAEISLVQKLHDALPENSILYLGNSLSIRYFELIQTKRFDVHGNRGANGIDGQIASAIGLALSTTQEVYCLVGDMTLTYDLSSLLSLPKNLHVIVMNNGGGKIFETLKLDPRLVMAHERNFEAIARGFGLSYATAIAGVMTAQLTELFPDPEESELFLNRWSA